MRVGSIATAFMNTATAFMNMMFINTAFINMVTVASGVMCPFPHHDAVVPVRGEVIGRFVEPACERCAGRRGVLVRTVPGDTVRATHTGEVTFAGHVGGVLWVVQQVAPGVRVSYGRLAELADGVRVGAVIAAATPVARASSRTHLGVRRGSRYLDPLWCWAGRARLVPLPGSGSQTP